MNEQIVKIVMDSIHDGKFDDTELLISCVVDECIEAGRRCGGIVWQDLVKNADIEHNMKRQLGLVKPRTLKDA